MKRRWEWIILSVRSWSVFEENIVVTVLAKLVPLFFKCSCVFFLTRSLIERCQIVTDTCKTNVSKFVWKPSLLFNFHHLYFNFYSLKNCSVYGKDGRVVPSWPVLNTAVLSVSVLHFGSKIFFEIHISKIKNCSLNFLLRISFQN